MLDEGEEEEIPHGGSYSLLFQIWFAKILVNNNVWVEKQQAVGTLKKWKDFSLTNGGWKTGRDVEGGSSGELGGWLFALSICVHGGGWGGN